MPGVKDAQLPLLKAGMQLDLAHGRNYAGLVEQSLQVRDVEIGDADRFRAAFLLELGEGPPGIRIGVALPRRPMDEVEVDIVGP
jgi:hypothetical protein